MRTIVVIVAAALLAGCAIGYKKAMTADMNGLAGKPIRSVTDRLGYPSRELSVAGGKVYVWERDGCTLKVGVDSVERVITAD